MVKRVAIEWHVTVHGPCFPPSYPDLGADSYVGRFASAAYTLERAIEHATQQAIFFGWYVPSLPLQCLLDQALKQSENEDEFSRLEQLSAGWVQPESSLPPDSFSGVAVTVTFLGISACKDPAWLLWQDSTVARIIRSLEERTARESMPILADALEDAGCENLGLLHYLRNPGQLSWAGCVNLLDWLASFKPVPGLQQPAADLGFDPQKAEQAFAQAVQEADAQIGPAYTETGMMPLGDLTEDEMEFELTLDLENPLDDG